VLNSLIDQVEASATAKDVRALLRPHRGETGLCAAYFGRLQFVYAADAGRALRLAGHWRAFLDLGDDPALAYRAKGAADRMKGHFMASARAFQQAATLSNDEILQSSYAIGAVDSLARAARIDEAVELGLDLASRLDALQRPQLAALARLNAANALLHAERGAESRELFERAIPELAKAGLVREESMARLGLSTTHLYGGDPELSRREAEAGKRLAEQVGLNYLASLCEMNLAHFAIISGRSDEALSALLPLRERLVGSPADSARLEESIGDACLRLNLLDEAAGAYREALQQRDALPAVDRAHVLFGLGEVLAPSDPIEADRYYSEASARYRALGNRHWRAAALAARAELQRETHLASRFAAKAVEEAEGSPYHLCLALLARAQVSSKTAKEDLARVAILMRTYGFRRFAWRIHALRAAHSPNPLSHYRRMFAEMLRDRLATSSVAARMGFLRDKSEALGKYLSHLLAKPTEKNVAEAREAIRQTRAATLLDEILHSESLRLDPNQIEQWERLREQFAFDSSESNIPDARGLAAAPARPSQRTWTETTHVLAVLDVLDLPPPTSSGVILAELNGNLWAIHEEGATALPISADKLEESLRWLAFELEVPTADRNAPAEEALQILAELRTALVDPWIDQVERPLRLCPDGLLWRVPWDALLDSEEAATLMLHPSLSGGQIIGQLDRVAVWVDACGDLPSAVTEVATIQKRFPGAEIFRSRAEVLASMGSDWDLVHVICHARHNSGNPMFSSLEFSDGPVYAAEIARSPLRTRLACLSACETGTISNAARQEPDGMVRAFLARGAEAVLASLWPLDDEAASVFFETLYNRIAATSDLSEAVSDARCTVRAWRGHPYFWASLSLFGGYRT